MADGRKGSNQSSKAVDSARALARALDVSVQAVRKWLVHPAWNFGPRPPWNVEQVRAWRAANLQPDLAAVDPPPRGRSVRDLTPMEQAKLAVLAERAKKIRLEREILEGQFTSNEELDRRDVQRIHHLKSSLFAMARSVAAELVGHTAAEITVTLTDRMTDLCNEFAEGHDQEIIQDATSLAAGEQAR